MKKCMLFPYGLLALLAGILLVVFFMASRSRVSLNFVKYQRWPHGALLCLSNGTARAVRYVVQDNGTASGGLLLRLERSSGVWSNASPPLHIRMVYDSSMGRLRESISLSDPGTAPRVGRSVNAARTRVLEVGQSVNFFVKLDPDDSPIKVGTLYLNPESNSGQAKTIRSFVERLRRWCGLAPAAAGQREAWCPEPLVLAE